VTSHRSINIPYRSDLKIKLALLRSTCNRNCPCGSEAQWKRPPRKPGGALLSGAAVENLRLQLIDTATARLVVRGKAKVEMAVTVAEHFSSLIGELYDAALEPALWPDVLARTAVFVGGSAAALYCKDAATKTGGVYYDCGGCDPHFKQIYFEEYIKIDPTTTGHCFAAIGEPIATADILPYDEFLASRFYRDWVRPQELVDNISVALEKSASGAALFAVFRHQRHGLADDEARRRMRLVAPHVRRAALVGRTIAHKSAEAAAFAGALDGLGTGITLIDGGGHVLHANAAGKAMLSEGSVLRSTRGKLAATDAEAERTLQDVIAAASGGDIEVGGKGIAMPLRGHNGDHYVAHALPLASSARRTAGGNHAIAAVFIQKATMQAPPAPEAIARTFNLTPTELRVLLTVVEMGGVSDTAEALGIGQATVKTHLHRLFRKTGTNRQADLVRLVAGFSPPLVG